MEKQNEHPTLIVIFGGSGDLAHRKLIPALYSLEKENLLPKKFKIISFARKNFSNTQYRNSLLKVLRKQRTRVSSKVWARFSKKISYLQSSFENKSGYEELNNKVLAFDKQIKLFSNKIFYLATPPFVNYQILRSIRLTNLNKCCESRHSRVVAEKPFGDDLESAVSLNKELRKVFREDQIYRIDHFLGKETVQNLLIFRFANELFNSIWDRDHIDHIQITISESIGVENRGTYYDSAGALKDIIQNHALQLLALTAMEQPKHFDEKSIRDSRVEILESLEPYTKKEIEKNIIRGQYSAGKTRAYRQEVVEHDFVL
ncbi:MAG TPA: glucose-6-phosphate dehydrogenase (NADP(+)), partial [bacterium]|nr:glucose-6-phosphate dehydrogenase (NADP(+)) [bacterium]